MKRRPFVRERNGGAPVSLMTELSLEPRAAADADADAEQ